MEHLRQDRPGLPRQSCAWRDGDASLGMPETTAGRSLAAWHEEMSLSATDPTNTFNQNIESRFSCLGPVAALMFLAVGLAGCEQSPQASAAPAALPVTVAQPLKRTVTDWDEFTGRFEAIP